MSQSLGNTIVPQEVIKESGAEIIRLWVAMTEFTEELRVSKEILTRVVDFYRKLRNTCRILVANLYDFDPATDRVPLDQLDAVDKFAVARYARAQRPGLRVVVVTGYPNLLVPAGLGSPPPLVFAKPLDYARLLEELQAPIAAQEAAPASPRS